MADVLHYPNAPITEAIIDLRVKPREGLTIEALRHVGEGEKEKYPTDSPIVEAVGMMEVKPGVSASASAQQRPLGFKFVSEDQKCVWQSRGNGFTFSRLAPYESWEPFSAEARRLWSVYRSAVNPEKVVRLAVRYVNRIDVPGSSVDLDEYFQTAPRISDGLPDNLSGFFMQLRIPDPQVAGQTVINQTIVPPAREDVVSIVLDIDIFSDQDVPDEEDAIWKFFERLHVRKNEVFESCITDSSRKLFQ